MIPEIVYGHYLKVPVCKTPDYIVSFEETTYGTFIHCDVFNWNKDVKSKILKTWDSIKELHGGPFNALHDPKDKKHEKFLSLFGFKKMQTAEDLTELWTWDN